MITPVLPARKDRLPHVAVVVPCYNYGHFLPMCIDSIISQAGVVVSVHIIDDCSPDGSGEVAERIAALNANVSVTRHARNQGHIATYNEGLSQVDSDYVVLLSADDLLTPGALARATALMDAKPKVGLVYGYPQSFWGSEPEFTYSRMWYWSVWPGESWIKAQFKRTTNAIYSPEAVVRTTTHHAAGYYDPAQPHTGDLDMWLRIASISGVGHINGPAQAFRREHPDSMMHKDFSAKITDLRERRNAYESFLRTSSLPAEQVRELRGLMSIGLSREALASLDKKTDGTEADELVAFAEEVNPDYQHLREWRNLPTASESGAATSRRGFDDVDRWLRKRTLWRRWRYYGV